MFGRPSIKREGQTMLNMCMEQCEGVYLMDEIERLREALRQIANMESDPEFGFPPMATVQKIAQDALDDE